VKCSFNENNALANSFQFVQKQQINNNFTLVLQFPKIE